MRILFFNEGNLGSHIMGQGQLDEALRVGLAESPGVEARFAGLLEQGQAVQVYFDMPGSRPTAFLGKPVMLARGSARLAKRAEALVMPIHTRREGHRAVTSIGAALDAREYASPDALHDALAVLHERAILQTPEQLEDPNRAGAWEGGATAVAWMRPGDRQPTAEEPAPYRSGRAT